MGTGEGSVLWFRNVGTRQEPSLAAARTLIPPPAEGSQRGGHARICVVDFNGDGRKDILLGDCGEAFEKELDDDEKQWRERAHKEQAAMLGAWAGVFREYRALMKTPLPVSNDLRGQRQEELGALRRELQRLKGLRSKYYREEQALEPGKQYHGRVWVFLRQAPRDAS